jgi:hypothetical protein
LFSGLDKIVGYFTFGLVDLQPDDQLQDINDDLPGGFTGRICNQLKKTVTNYALTGTDNETLQVKSLLNSVTCGCQLLGLGGEMKFGCNVAEPICIAANLDIPDLPANVTIEGSDNELCAEANVRAVYNGRSLFTPFAKETLKVEACGSILSAPFVPSDAVLPRLCVKAETNDGLLNLVSLKSCEIFAIYSNKTIEKCNSCNVCGTDGLGVSFDCSNIIIDESGQLNFTIPSFADQCLSSGTIPLGKVGSSDFQYRPFLTPMP